MNVQKRLPILVACIFTGQVVMAAESASPNFVLEEDAMTTGEGASSSPNFVVESVVGEVAVPGETSSENYTAQTGYPPFIAYGFLGFFSPVDNLPTLNTVKNGSTVPIKWKLLDAGGNLVTDTAALEGSQYVSIQCDGNLPQDAVETTVSGGSILRWDSSTLQFVYNWKTPSLPNRCVRLDLTFNDGTTHSAYFKLK